jgi:hypothetical protein
VHAFAEECADPFCLLPRVWIARKFVRQHARAELDSRKMLAKAIVQILSNAQLFPIGYREQLFFELPAHDRFREHVGDRLEEMSFMIVEAALLGCVCA